jgi:hypothetical protein
MDDIARVIEPIMRELRKQKKRRRPLPPMTPEEFGQRAGERAARAFRRALGLPQRSQTHDQS